MKIKFPKKIVVGSYTFIVKTDKKRGDGYFSYDDGVLFIGTRMLKKQPYRVLEIIIHELKELIQVEQYVRYTRNDEEKSYLFSYTHKEHAELCSLLAGYLKEFIV